MAQLPSRVEMAATIRESARRLSELCDAGAPEYVIETCRRGLLWEQMGYCRRRRLVVIAALRDQQRPVLDLVDQAVLVVDAARPVA